MSTHHDPDTDEPNAAPATSFEGWATSWEVVPGDDGVVDDLGRRRRVRLLVAACVAGAMVIIALLVVGVRVLVHDLDGRHESPEAVHDRYQRQYSSCVTNGAASQTCADRAARACLADPGLRSAGNADIARACAISTRQR